MLSKATLLVLSSIFLTSDHRRNKDPRSQSGGEGPEGSPGPPCLQGLLSTARAPSLGGLRLASLVPVGPLEPFTGSPWPRCPVAAPVGAQDHGGALLDPRRSRRRLNPGAVLPAAEVTRSTVCSSASRTPRETFCALHRSIHCMAG